MGSGGSLSLSGLFSKAKPALAGDSISPDFKAGGGERADVYEPTQAEAPMQGDRPQYIPGSAYAAAFDPAYQALTPYAQAYLNQFNMPNTAQMLGGNQSLEEKLTAAGQNRVPGQDVNLGEMPSQQFNYGNLRPDMLINPAAAGWVKYNQIPGFEMGTQGPLARAILSGQGINPATAYTDSEGNVWYRKS